MVDTQTVRARLDDGRDDWTLLDVREIGEVEDASIAAARHIYLGHLNEEWQELDKDRAYTLMCASGKRATVAAGWLASKGFEKLDIYLGSMGAWQASQDQRD
ncbi:rhodanese-like domain-containing protein [Hyphobacterium sp.]|uniref:rhodanese-like domain-containing protein n=1 Tax=Hyphobacterium sp. TaxID=2004662 RepID=UPI003B5215F2